MRGSDGGSRLLFFLAGFGIGAIVALLFAPKSGEETRQLIGKKAEEGRDYVTAKGKELRRAAEDFVEKGRKSAEDLVEKGKSVTAKI